MGRTGRATTPRPGRTGGEQTVGRGPARECAMRGSRSGGDAGSRGGREAVGQGQRRRWAGGAERRGCRLTPIRPPLSRGQTGALHGGGVAVRETNGEASGQALAADLISVAGHSTGAAPNTY